MEYDKNLLEATVKLITNYQEIVPVFKIKQSPIKNIENFASLFAQKFVSEYSLNSTRLHTRREKVSTLFDLPDAKLRVYHASGAIMAKRNIPPFEKIIAERLEEMQVIDKMKQVIKNFNIDSYFTNLEHLEFERLWRLKGLRFARSGKKVQEILCRVIGAFRRYVNDLPILGAASFFLKFGSENTLISAGLDFRELIEKPFDSVPVIDPESGGKKVLMELQSDLSRQTLSIEDYHPEKFTLGYFSLPKRQQQRFFQPIYLAFFRAKGEFCFNRLIVVPASDVGYESLSIPVKHPPRPYISRDKKQQLVSEQK